MSLDEYIGAIILEVDSTEYDVESVGVDYESGRTIVKTMNRAGKAKGYANGIESWTLKITAPIPKTSTLDLDNIIGGKLTIYPTTDDGTRESYLDSFLSH